MATPAPPLVNETEVEFSAVRSQGPGGQNVNKVSTAIHLRFDVAASSLPQEVKDRLLALPGSRVSKDGILGIKAQSSRSQEFNKAEAMARLNALVAQAAQVQAPRRATRPTLASKRRRLEGKAIRAQTKLARAKPAGE